MSLKNKSVVVLKSKLDSYFSRYIRLRDSNEYGVGTCIICGNKVHWKDASCGHYISRSHTSTRYDEYNCNLQCPSCNNLEGASLKSERKQIYAQKIDEKFGKGTVDFLKSKAQITVPYTKNRLIYLLHFYNVYVQHRKMVIRRNLKKIS